ncbi:MAG: glycosyltransferase [Flavobacteriales bacterium]|nr:glycosyltransferase [Flavobacteriales bacterium]MCC6936965.1 glycosyltransferase [Flavobacteriales bacterium]
MVFLLIPTYNEEENIPKLALELAPYVARTDVRIILSDDGSRDRTRDVITTCFPMERTTILGDGINRGPGHAFAVGFEHILLQANDNDLVVTMEADRTSDITILPDMLAIAGLGYDLVLASVYAQGGGFQKTTVLRKLLSAAANFLFRSIFDLKVSTLSSFYRVYRVPALRKVKERWTGLISEPGFICMLELLLKLIRVEARVIEVPMILASGKRIGKSNMKLARTTLEYFRFLVRFRMNG